MQKLNAALRWAWANKAKVGALIAAAGTVTATWGHDYDALSKALLAVGGLLVGGGALKSDSAVKAQQEWEKTGQDRREN